MTYAIDDGEPVDHVTVDETPPRTDPAPVRDSPPREVRVRTDDELALRRSLVALGLLAATTGLTASWYLLNPWITAGIAVGALLLVGAVTRWRQGARPRLGTLRLSSRPAQAPPARGGGQPRTARGGTGSKNGSRTGRRTMAGTRRAAPRTGARTVPIRTGAAARTSSRTGRVRIIPVRVKKRTDKRSNSMRWARTAAGVLLSPVALVGAAIMGIVEAIQAAPPPSPAPAAEPKPEPKPEPKAKKTKPKKVPVPVPGPTITRPAPAATTSGTTMPSSAISAAVDAIRDHIGGYTPANVPDLVAFIGGLPDVFDALSESLARVATHFGDDQPIDPRVVDHLHELQTLLAGPADYARDVLPVFQAAHEHDLERLDNPRPNEPLLDVSNQ